MKILVVGGALNYARWISDDIEFVKEVKDADLVLFTGGEDVCPTVYDEECNHKTCFSRKRDIQEIEVYRETRYLSKSMIGICRGSQLLTALQPNGRLVQHVDNHGIGGTHDIIFKDGTILPITSTHHQMMYPFNINHYELIAWASPARSSNYEFGPHDSLKTLHIGQEPEIIFYPRTKCLCIQGHPEHMRSNCETVIKLRELVKEKLKL